MAREPHIGAQTDDGGTAWEAPLPTAVRRQVERANRLITNPEEANNLFPQNGNTNAGGVAASASPDNGTMPAPPSGDGASPAQPPSGEAELPPGTVAVPSGDAPAQLSAPDWEQRFNTLQGKYNSETAELRGELKSLREMFSQRDYGRDYDRRNPPQTEIPPPPPAPYIPAEDVENYGQDLITASQRWADAKYQPIINELQNRLRQVESGNQQLNMMSVTQRCEQQLDQIIPGWRTTNTDPNFISWLGQIDPFSGQTRQSMINQAYGAGDANRTALFFQAYQREHTAVTPAPAGRLEGHTGEPAATQPLMDLVVPGRAQSAPLQAPGAPSKRMWTRDEIAAFYNAKRRGYWRGREAEADRIEQDLVTAQGEGRIRT